MSVSFPRLCLAVLVAVAAPCAATVPATPPDPAVSTAQAAQAGADGHQPRPAARATRIPEPDTIVLFLLGGAGLVIGRRLSRSRRPHLPQA